MQNAIIIFIHLLSAAIGVGASAFCLLLLLPKIEKSASHQTLDENSIIYKMMETLAPTIFVCVLLLVGSGVYYLMENYTDQVNLKDGYYNVLGIKLIFAVIAFFLSAYLTFGLRSKIAHLDLRPENKSLVRPTLEKMRLLSQASMWTIGIALFLGVYLARY